MTFDWIFYIRLVLAGVVSYLIGSISPAILVSEKLLGSDIREHGSGNAGMTNSFRVMGFKGGIIVMALDLIKGVVAVLAGWLVAGSLAGQLVSVVCLTAGHCFPIFFGFKGGKGVLVTAGAFLVLDWRMSLAAIGVFLIVLFFSKMVSLSSMLGALSLPVWGLVFNDGIAFVIVGAINAAFLIFMHRSNISRILNGTESKVGRKKE